MQETTTAVKSKLKLIFTALALSLTLGFTTQLAYAQPASQTNDSGGFVPCGNTVDNPCNIGHLFKAFKVIVNYLIVMAGFIAVLAIVYASFLLVTAGGRPEQLATGKKRLSGAIIGMIIVAAAFVLINALFDGSLSIGVCNGGKVLSDPRGYINGSASCN